MGREGGNARDIITSIQEWRVYCDALGWAGLGGGRAFLFAGVFVLIKVMHCSYLWGRYLGRGQAGWDGTSVDVNSTCSPPPTFYHQDHLHHTPLQLAQQSTPSSILE